MMIHSAKITMNSELKKMRYYDRTCINDPEKLSQCLIKYHGMKVYQVEEQLRVSESLVSRSGHFTPGERAPVPTGQEAGWAPEPVWMLLRKEKSLAPARN
jgi:hypothetical protein